MPERPAENSKQLLCGFFLAASKLTRNGLVKVQNKRKKIIIEKN
jgi:hypothetical protein